jgi:predicted dehydrogenase
MRVLVIGCGSVGRRRSQLVSDDPKATLIAVADVDATRAEAVARERGCEAVTDALAAVQRADVDAVVVSTSNDQHAPLAMAALRAGKHVLVEKPLARRPEEAAELVQVARKAGKVLQTGFNHRFYPSVKKARQLIAEGAIGEPILCRCRYGHGARDTFPNEWFTNHKLSGGGTFLDNGVHALDLFRVFLGDFAEATGFVGNLVWQVQPCEDNGMGVFRTSGGKMAMLHSSWTQWDINFAFEVFGTQGFLNCESNERLTMGGRIPTIGHPPTQTWNFVGQDRSWADDWAEFAAAVRESRDPDATGEAGLAAVRMAHAVYEASSTGRTVRLDGSAVPSA